MLKNIGEYFKKLKEDLNKIKTYQYNITRDIDCLVNEIPKEEYYEPIEIKSALTVIIKNTKAGEIMMIIYH